jgi:hypothetical protein
VPTVRIGALGLSGGPAGPGGSPGARGEVFGWSPGSARRNAQFLRSVDPTQLPVGLTFTLTLRDLPPEGDWHRLRDNLGRHLRRLRCRCWHYVVEWTKRGIPHLHGVIFFDDPDGTEARSLVSGWLRWAGEWGAGSRGQHIAEMYEVTGWFEYASKHMARGAGALQRDSEAAPKSWSKTGRMWSKGGAWPQSECVEALTDAEWFIFRRWVERWQAAAFKTKERRTTGWRSESWRRSRMWLRHRRVFPETRVASASRGLSLFIPDAVAHRFLKYLRDQALDRPRVRAVRSEDHATFYIRDFVVRVQRPAGVRDS